MIIDKENRHYIFFVRNEKSWTKFDNSKVSIVDEINHGEDAFLLFYEKETVSHFNSSTFLCYYFQIYIHIYYFDMLIVLLEC